MALKAIRRAHRLLPAVRRRTSTTKSRRRSWPARVGRTQPFRCRNSVRSAFRASLCVIPPLAQFDFVDPSTCRRTDSGLCSSHSWVIGACKIGHAPVAWKVSQAKGRRHSCDNCPPRNPSRSKSLKLGCTYCSLSCINRFGKRVSTNLYLYYIWLTPNLKGALDVGQRGGDELLLGYDLESRFRSSPWNRDMASSARILTTL